MRVTMCNMASSGHHGLELLFPGRSANSNTSGSQPLANNYMQNNVDIQTSTQLGSYAPDY